MINHSGLRLFDADDLVATLMSATGADAFTARFMVALDRGEITGDATFVHTPGQEDAMFPELAETQLVRVTLSPSTASHHEDGSTVVIRLNAASAEPEVTGGRLR